MNTEKTFLALSVAFTFLVFGVTPVHAMDAEQTAQTAALADGVSTVLALSAGAVESNPVINGIGLGPATLIKMAVPYAVRDASPETRKAVLTGASGFYSFAAVANVLLWLVPGIREIRFVLAIPAGYYFAQRTADKVDAEELAKAQEAVRVASHD